MSKRRTKRSQFPPPEADIDCWPVVAIMRELMPSAFHDYQLAIVTVDFLDAALRLATSGDRELNVALADLQMAARSEAMRQSMRDSLGPDVIDQLEIWYVLPR